MWRWLILAYPAEFRSEYGSELVQALDDRYLELRGFARFWFCLKAAADVVATGSRERYLTMLQDFTHSLRRFAAHPGVAAVAVLSLALGIGANTTMFSIIYSSLLKPLPYPESDRRVAISMVSLKNPGGRNQGPVTSADFIDLRRQSTSLQDMHMYTMPSPATVKILGLPERAVMQSVTPGFLESLGARPVIGRFFGAGEESERPIVISESYWERRFGRQPDIVGLNVGEATIIGVAPASFGIGDGYARADFWNTINLSAGSIWIQRSMPWIYAAGKLKPGVPLAQAQAEVSGIAANLTREYPATNRDRGIGLMSMIDARNGEMGFVLYPLFGAVGFVLLIACANVANLLLARATARSREISLRAAMGASRGRLIREFLVDGIVLAIPGVAAGLLLAYLGIALVRISEAPGFAGVADAELNWTVLAFTAAVAVTAGLLSAIFPALAVSRVDVAESLKEGGRGSGGRKRERLRSLLVAGEIALALVLLVGAGLMINSVRRMQNHPLGFEPRGVTVAQLEMTGKRYMLNAPMRDIDMQYVEPPVSLFLEHTLEQVRALPGVEHVALVGGVPMGPGETPSTDVRIAGEPATDGRHRWAAFNPTTNDFLGVLGIRLKSGRYFNGQDRESTAWVAVVNEAFAREFFPKHDPLGQVIMLGRGGPDERPRQIVGVIADYTQYHPRRPVQPAVYTSYSQQTREIRGNYKGVRFRPRLIVKASAAGAPKEETIKKIVADFDKEIAVFNVKPLEWHVERLSGPFRFYTNTLMIFSGIALLLAAIGIYGLMSYSVTDRFQEIGIRLSLGATRSSIVWLILSACLKLSAAGLTVGVAGALAATRLLEALLFGVKPWDPATFALVTIFLLTVAVVASALPAFRATRVNAIVALRRD
jgi:putative ABC transport system permease protein